MTWWLAGLLLLSGANAAPQRSAATAPPPRSATANDVWSRLDHDRFVEALGSQGLGTTLEALDRSEPSADPIESLRRRLAVARLPLVAADRDPAAVAAAAASAVALRDSLLETSGERHPLRGRRLADQVEEILLWILPSEGADLAVRFGVASSRQRAFVDRWLPLAEAYSAEAIEAHEIATERLDREFSSRGGSLAPAEELLLRRLREERGRIAFLRGLALATSAELLASASDRQAMRRTAIELLEAERGNAPPDLDELARIALGHARSALGEHPIAQREFTALADDAAASSRARFEARAGLVLDSARREDADNALRRLAAQRRSAGDGPDQRAFRLAWADLEHRLVREDLASRGVPAPEAAIRALEPWVGLLENAEPSLRDLYVDGAVERLTLAGASIADGDPKAPPMLLFARASALESAIESGASDPSAGVMRRALLERVASAAAAGSAARFLALRSLARLEVSEGRWNEAVEALLAMAVEEPDDPGASTAIAAAVDLSASLADQLPDDEEAASLARTTLGRAMQAFPMHPERDEWRLRRASHELRDGRFEDAMNTLATVPADRPASLEARVQSLETATRAAEAAEGRDVARWIDRAEQWLRQLEPWRPMAPDAADSQSYRDLGARVALARARLHLLADRPAAALVEVATVRESGPLTREQTIEGVRIRLAAFDRLGRPEEAADELRRLSASGDTESGSLLESRLETALAGARRAEADGDVDRATRIGRESAAPLADALLAWLDARSGPPPARKILLCVEGLRRGGRPSAALETIVDLEPRYANVREFALERAECLYAVARLEDLTEAIVLYRRIAAGSPEGSPAWWLAELRQLQILRRVGRELERIGPRIARLRELDPDLGGEGFRREFEALLLDLR
jgi:hypothetical protein